MKVRNKAQPGLVDPFGRQITYLRLSVTDRCNLRCVYCMAEDMTFLPRQRILTLEEMVDIAAAFTRQGVTKIRLTGGEPLVRQGVVALAERLGDLPGLRELTMTTNGILLGKYAQGLWSAGIRRLNVSLDSLDPRRFQDMTRTGELQQVLAGIDSARALGFAIKLNTVVLAGVNDQEVNALARYAVEQGMDISFIEEMPLGHIDSHRRADTRFFSERIRERLANEFDLVASTETTGGPSRYFRVQGHSSRIGFISPLSNNFCTGCNRVRLTVEGRLLLCLGNEDAVDLKTVVRAHPGDSERLEKAIRAAIGHKPEKHHFDPERVDIVRFMNATGG